MIIFIKRRISVILDNFKYFYNRAITHTFMKRETEKRDLLFLNEELY